MAFDAENFKPKVIVSIPPKPADPVKEALIRARDLIKERGWGRGDFCKFDSSRNAYDFCILGAIYASDSICEMYTRYDPESTKVAMINRIKSVIPEHAYKIKQDGANIVPFYNDKIAESKEEILALFDRAIESEA